MVTQESTSRREFLRRTGLAAAGFALAPGIVNARNREGLTMNSDKKIRIGVVGGNFGCSFQWHEHPNCIVEAVSDLIPERRQRLKDTYKCGKSYESLEKLILDKNVDAVAIFTGAPDHVRHAVACMKEGKHVISAVPTCMSVAEAEQLLDTVKRTGLTYMMAETSFYHQTVISARKFFAEGKFGDIFYVEAEYYHPGLEPLFFNPDGSHTWRYGFPPMHYPTHCTSYLVGVTKERMTQVSCTGWGDDSPILKDNTYNNPFWNETALFTTNGGHSFRVAVYWNAAVRGCERGQWFGTKMSYFDPEPNGLGTIIVRAGTQTEKDEGGFERKLSPFEQYEQPEWWKTDMLPEPLRHQSGHGGSHTFLTHEFIDALVNERPPTIDIYESLAITVPGIIAHKSALEGGKQMKIPQFDPKPAIA
ncbi:MAG: Gfo/Idh/MocA family oxidoreductase [Armatimonadetes bacterium]|nr:Gfo/Idh/MocA family oxidoreductase [Armatimonadota bacterium]